MTNLVDGKLHNTFWKYDQEGRVTNKLDHTLAESFRYTYDAEDRLLTRWTPEKGTTAYAYDAVGNLTNVNYSASTDLNFRYDANNRLTNMVDASGTSVFAWNGNGALESEEGPWNQDRVSYGYNSARLRQSAVLQQVGGVAWTNSYVYDPAMRLTNITSPAGVFAHDYDSTAMWSRKKIYYPNGSYVTNSFDSVARLRTTALRNSSHTALNSHAYGYNAAHQRMVMTNVFTNRMEYAYDSAGQLTNAAGKYSVGAARLHEQFTYGYDAAGNLSTRTNYLLVQSFTVNDLNELTGSTRTGSYVISGGTIGDPSSVTVKVNSGTASSAFLYNDKTYTRSGVTLPPGNNTFTAVATDSAGRTATNTVTAYHPTSVTFDYDDNGNLISDGQNGYAYDDENQLIQITRTNEWRSTFTYDGKMRRRITTEQSWVSGAWATTKIIQFIYDGNLVIEERHYDPYGALTERVTYTRGHDLSGSLQGAGGIGGLLARSDSAGTGLGHSYYHADGNGNITALVNAHEVVVARYHYDPFGRKIAETGPLAAENAYQWSSKEHHSRSGLAYYLYRYYSPELQRWVNEDPFAETGFEVARVVDKRLKFPFETPTANGWQGGTFFGQIEARFAELIFEGPNLYTFVANRPTAFVDPHGLLIKQLLNEVDPCLGDCYAKCTDAHKPVRVICVVGCLGMGPGYLGCVGACFTAVKASEALCTAACYGGAKR